VPTAVTLAVQDAADVERLPVELDLLAHQRARVAVGEVLGHRRAEQGEMPVRVVVLVGERRPADDRGVVDRQEIRGAAEQQVDGV
jgi:hypothetical protein